MNMSTIKLIPIGLSAAMLIALQSEAVAHSVESGVRACAAIEDDDARLQCFDALAADMSNVPAAEAAARPAPSSASGADSSDTGDGDYG